jgi:hypothetical protein
MGLCKKKKEAKGQKQADIEAELIRLQELREE